MLRQIIALFQENQATTLAPEAICARLNIPPDVLAQLLQTLLRRGRLVAVGGCAGCDACPLTNYCATTPAVSFQGYALAKPEATADPDPTIAAVAPTSPIQPQ